MSRVTLPLRYEMPGARVTVDECNSLSGWSLSSTGAGGTLAVAADAGPNGEDVLEFAVVGAADQRRATKSDKAIRNTGSIGIWVRWPDYPTAAAGLTIFLSPDNFTNYFSHTIQPLENSNKITDGWEFRVIPKSQFANQGGAANSWGLAQTHVRLIAAGSAALANARTQVGPMYANLRTRPKIMLMFDDGNITDLTQAFPIVEAAGFKATTYVIAALVGSAEYLTLANLQSLYEDGWDIGCHHQTVFRGAALNTQVSYIQEARNFLNANGMPRGADHVSYPLGQYDPTTGQAMAAVGMKTGRTIVNFPQSTAVAPMLYRLQARGLDTAGSATGVTALQEVDRCIDNGASIGLYMHGMYGTGIHWTTAHLTTLCAGLRERVNRGLCDVVTISEFYDGLSEYQRARIGSAV